MCPKTDRTDADQNPFLNGGGKGAGKPSSALSIGSKGLARLTRLGEEGDAGRNLAQEGNDKYISINYY